MEGNSYGIELAIDWRLLDWWRLQFAYTYIALDLKGSTTGSDLFSQTTEGSSPEHQSSLGSFVNLGDSWRLDLWFRYVDKLPTNDIDSYLEMDAQLNWQIRSGIDLTLVGQNLLDSHHPEYVAEFLNTQPTEARRGVYAKISMEFE